MIIIQAQVAVAFLCPKKTTKITSRMFMYMKRSIILKGVIKKFIRPPQKIK